MSAIEKLRSEKYFQLLVRLVAELKVRAYLTGGGLRDNLLDRRSKDLDFALENSAAELPRLFGAQAGGSFFWLDRDRQQSRVIVRTEQGVRTFDFAPLHGTSIEDDLSRRDFTINAMALELADESVLFDPFQGEVDLRNKIIRKCSHTAFQDDPLRLLRGIRLAAVLGFTVEPGTLTEIREKAPLLERAAVERIRSEFMQILESPEPSGSLVMLHEAGLLKVLLPDVWQERVKESSVVEWTGNVVRFEEVVRDLSFCLPDGGRRLAAYLRREMEGGITALSLVKLAAFTEIAEHPGNADAWARRLSLGKKAGRMMVLLSGNPAPDLETLAAPPGRRALFRYYRDFDPAGVELALLALAREEVTLGMCTDLINYYIDEYEPDADNLLLSGEEVMRLLGTGSGPAVGAALERLREAESRGLVNNSEEAREFLEKYLLTNQEPMS